MIQKRDDHQKASFNPPSYLFAKSGSQYGTVSQESCGTSDIQVEKQ